MENNEKLWLLSQRNTNVFRHQILNRTYDLPLAYSFNYVWLRQNQSNASKEWMHFYWSKKNERNVLFEKQNQKPDFRTKALKIKGSRERKTVKSKRLTYCKIASHNRL